MQDESGLRNLAAEGADSKKVYFVGNVMIDSWEASRRLWQQWPFMNRVDSKAVHTG